MNNSLNEIALTLRSASRIGLACHVRPDADAIGSICALGQSLRLLGKQVSVFSEDGVPENLAFLPSSDQVVTPDGNPMDFDVFVALDTAAKERLGERTNKTMGGVPILVDIDHHGTNPRYGHLNFIDVPSPSCAEIVYELITTGNFPMDDTVRQNVYAGMNTDTGSFQYSGTRPRTHRIVAEMMEAGLNTSDLCTKIYDHQPRRRLQLLRAMLNEMQFSCDDRVASWQLTLDTLARAEARAGDTENLIDLMRSVDGVLAAVIIEELPDGKIRISSRSKDQRIDVSQVCGQFGGGGHRMAAGARMKGPIAEAAERFLKALHDEIKRVS
jgi:bifunctional oligoribonuclease and PAP phosphatase NrnA